MVLKAVMELAGVIYNLLLLHVASPRKVDGLGSVGPYSTAAHFRLLESVSPGLSYNPVLNYDMEQSSALFQTYM